MSCFWLGNCWCWTGSLNIAKAVFHSERVNVHFDNTLNKVHHAVLMSGGDSNDIYTFKQMLQEPDRAELIQAMIQEVKDHEQRVDWSIVPRSTMSPDTEIILTIWSFKRKRFPD